MEREKGKVQGRPGERGKAMTPNRYYVGYMLGLLYSINNDDVNA